MDKQTNFLQNDDFIAWRLFRTEEQDAYWENFILENPELKEELMHAVSQFNSLALNEYSLPEAERDEVYEGIEERIYSKRKRISLWRRLSSVAAIIVVLIVSGYFAVQYDMLSYFGYDVDGVIVGQTLPGEEVYIISGKNKVNLSNNSLLELKGDKKALVTDSLGEKQELNLGGATMNRLVVPYGKRSNITLADGSKIWVNSGTQLDFPSEFKGKSREISVNGEVFIQVKEDQSRPFIVHAGGMDVRVYGTSFNVMAFDDDDTKTVVLVNGKVGVKSDGKETTMEPSEKLEIKNGTVSKEIVDVDEYISWTRDVLQFNETPIAELLKKIGRYYNVEFENSPGVKLNTKTVSGKLFLSTNLDSVMTSISYLTDTKYHRENNTIHIN